MGRISSVYNMFVFKVLPVVLVIILVTSCNSSANDTLREQFANPPAKYKPKPLWFINGELTTEGIRKQMTDAKEKAGFSGVALLPMAGRSEKHPGTSPEFLSEKYFDRYFDVLNTAKELNMEVILYDDNDFPSGMGGGKMEELYPDYTRKRIDKFEKEITGPIAVNEIIGGGKLMSAVAMNALTSERIDLSEYVKESMLHWDVPKGNWKIMFFTLEIDSKHNKRYLSTDYLDTLAVKYCMDLTYNVYAEKFGDNLGDVIKTVFFDDVGFFKYERAWTGAFNDKFIELNGYDPKSYYPALWYDIGPETQAVRHAFFKTRAELLADGYVKFVGEWAKKHGVKDTGHPPGNYRISPIDMNGDIFKFYRHTQMPLCDAILGYGTGQNGFKLVSSAADYYDRPLVATEVYGAFKESTFDALMLYRTISELMVRGVNYVIPHAMWYNSEDVHISPLISPENEKLAPALPAYSNFVGRASMLLQGGRRVSEIGVIYPFESIAGYFYFDAPKTRYGEFVSPETDYFRISNWLTNEIRRDFTFIHPEFFIEDKYEIKSGSVFLNNKENKQEYKVLILTGCDMITTKTLEKIRDFYIAGGKVIGTTQLPYKSATLGEDQKVIELIKEIFGVDPSVSNAAMKHSKSNSNGGQSIFISNSNKDDLSEALDELQASPDIIFENNPKLTLDFGKFSYIHKIKEGKDIYLFANSSDERINTNVMLRGKHKLEDWNPHKGIIDKNIRFSHVEKNGITYTKFYLQLLPVESMFFVSNQDKH